MMHKSTLHYKMSLNIKFMIVLQQYLTCTITTNITTIMYHMKGILLVHA